jgi:hypothetical protein
MQISRLLCWRVGTPPRNFCFDERPRPPILPAALLDTPSVTRITPFLRSVWLDNHPFIAGHDAHDRNTAREERRAYVPLTLNSARRITGDIPDLSVSPGLLLMAYGCRPSAWRVSSSAGRSPRACRSSSMRARIAEKSSAARGRVTSPPRDVIAVRCPRRDWKIALSGASRVVLRERHIPEWPICNPRDASYRSEARRPHRAILASTISRRRPYRRWLCSITFSRPPFPISALGGLKQTASVAWHRRFLEAAHTDQTIAGPAIVCAISVRTVGERR